VPARAASVLGSSWALFVQVATADTVNRRRYALGPEQVCAE
jgi:hypothetical protein